ncbi:MAG: FAD-binding protein [Pseudomonadales bacterium]|nr:FAD-binding protein [Pseudomonadales bacterium]
MVQWHHEVDFLVVGSGAAGMTAAITASVQGLSTMIVEKTSSYGGTSALSGGVLWLPDHHMMDDAGAEDSQEEALTYLNQVISDDVPADKLRAFVKNAGPMLAFMQKNSLLKYAPAKNYPDYYAELDGGKSGGRSVDPVPYTIRRLGQKLTSQMRSNKSKPGTFAMTAHEAHIVFSFTWKSPLVIYKRLLSLWLDITSRLKKLPDNRLTLGRALIGRLRKTLSNRDITLHLNTSADELCIEQGRVIGFKCTKDGKAFNIKVNRGVLMASGGFAHNKEMREKHHGTAQHAAWTAASTSDNGDGITVASHAGAATSMMSYAWWTPTMVYPDGKREAFIVGKSLPNSMVVNKKGLRFCNEAQPYEDFVKNQQRSEAAGNEAIPAYFIFDARYRREYPLGMAIAPGKYLPDSRFPELFNSGWIKKADSLAELAKACGIDAEGLATTAAKLESYSQTGEDKEFQRGNFLNDTYYSDHRVKPNPCLSGVSQAPFYAIKLWPGDLGTKGGLTTNADAQVIDLHGKVIDGLYAAGNVSASVMGDSYPAAGSTLGPAMTFAYVAAKHAASSRGV